MSSFKLPTHESTNEMLGMIFGEDMDIYDGEALNPEKCYVATFVDDDGALVGIGACDMAFGAYAGSALSLIPKAGADDAAKDGLSDAMVDNLYEVMNICSRLLMDDETPHLKLGKLLPPGEAPEEAAQIAKGGIGAHLKVDVPRYGLGLVSFYIT